MVKDAEAHAAEDEKLREKIDLKNQADSTVFQTEKFLKENEGKISAESKASVEAAIEPVKKAIESEDYEGMKTALDSLNEKVQAAATEIYSQAQGAAPGADAGASGMGGDPGAEEKQASDVEEADFEMVDEDKK